MNSQLPGNGPTYHNHRRQFWLQISLPMAIFILLVVAGAVFTGIAAFRADGDAPRWAAISTIWLIIPVMVFGLIVLAILVGLIYLLAQVLKATPSYTSKAQYYVNRGTGMVQRASDMVTKPILFLEGISASLKELLGKN